MSEETKLKCGICFAGSAGFGRVEEEYEYRRKQLEPMKNFRGSLAALKLVFELHYETAHSEINGYAESERKWLKEGGLARLADNVLHKFAERTIAQYDRARSDERRRKRDPWFIQNRELQDRMVRWICSNNVRRKRATPVVTELVLHLKKLAIEDVEDLWNRRVAKLILFAEKLNPEIQSLFFEATERPEDNLLRIPRWVVNEFEECRTDVERGVFVRQKLLPQLQDLRNEKERAAMEKFGIATPDVLPSAKLESKTKKKKKRPDREIEITVPLIIEIVKELIGCDGMPALDACSIIAEMFLTGSVPRKYNNTTKMRSLLNSVSLERRKAYAEVSKVRWIWSNDRRNEAGKGSRNKRLL